jgi:hypothetical protein
VVKKVRITGQCRKKQRQEETIYFFIMGNMTRSSFDADTGFKLRLDFESYWI